MKMLVVSNMYPSQSAPSYGVFVKNFCDQLETLHVPFDLAVMKKQEGKIKKLCGYLQFYFKSFLLCLVKKYDVVYVHYASHSSQGVLAARKLRRFCIYTNVHGSDVIPENSRQEKMQKNTRAILALSEKIVVPSMYFKQVVAKKYGIDKKIIHICSSGGINEKVFYPIPGKENATFTIGYVGRISHGKGWNTLLKACETMCHKDFQLLIVGDGPEKSQMVRYIEGSQLKSKIELRGLQPQEELAKIYNAIDVFVFPTEREGESLGLVAVEAMACGTPVIASDFAAPADYVADGKNGFTFEKGNHEELAQKLLKFMELDDAARNELKEGALATARNYTREKVTEELGKILQE